MAQPQKYVKTKYGEVLLTLLDDELVVCDVFGYEMGSINVNYWYSSDTEIAKAIERLL